MQHVQLTAASVSGIEDSLLLGDWCCTDSDGGMTESDEWFNSDADRAEHAAAFETVLDALSNWLNQIHQRDYPRAWWHLLLYRFLHRYIRYVFIRRRELQQGLSGETQQAMVLREEDWWTPGTDAAVDRRTLESDRFNLQLFSQIATLDGLNCDTFPADQFRFPAGDEEEKQPFSLRAVFRKLRKSLGSRQTDRWRDRTPLESRAAVFFDTHFPGSFIERLRDSDEYTLFEFGGWPAPRRCFRINDRLRRTLTRTAEAGTLADLVLASLPVCLPVDYVEGFRYHEQRGVTVLNRGVPKLIVAAFLPHVWSRCYVAQCQMQGARLVFVQHGGNYGESIFTPFEQSELSIGDAFVNWGWSSEGRHTSLSAPRLIQARDSIRGGSRDRLLFVVTVAGKYPGFRDRSKLAPGFLSQLDERLQRCTTVRYRLRKGGDESYCRSWMQRFPAVRFDPGRDPIFRAVADARLTVIGYSMSTTFLECLAADRPVLILDARWKQRVRASARPFYDRLASVGVIYDDSAECARAVAEIFDAPGDWWNDPQRQQIVSEFRQQFALIRTGEDPVAEWTSFLTGQVAVAAGVPALETGT